MPYYQPIISPGQGLLLLIDHYKNNPAQAEQLRKLYLLGPENNHDKDTIDAWLQDPILSPYRVSLEKKTINEDPTRRYFETHLAYQSLINGLDKVNADHLQTHMNNLYDMLPANYYLYHEHGVTVENIKEQVEHVLRGEFRPQNEDPLYQEYSHYINRIQTGELFTELSALDKEKITLLVKISFLGVINGRYTKMPLNIYGTGLYSEENKGKVMLSNQSSTRSQHLGLIKSYMPLPANDIAHSDKETPYLKPSDQATFIEYRQWVELNFAKMVHPFSNSISGTVLCQLRACAKLRNDNQGIFSNSGEEMGQFFQLLISAILYNSGGHSLHEFIAPFFLNQVRDEFSTTQNFDDINLESLYYTGNSPSFEIALANTIQYNKTLLIKQIILDQIKDKSVIDDQEKYFLEPEKSDKPDDLNAQVSVVHNNHDKQIDEPSLFFCDADSDHQEKNPVTPDQTDELNNLNSPVSICNSNDNELISEPSLLLPDTDEIDGILIQYYSHMQQAILYIHEGLLWQAQQQVVNMFQFITVETYSDVEVDDNPKKRLKIMPHPETNNNQDNINDERTQDDYSCNKF
ncbi:MAG: hypothetical protein ACOVQX_00485 [Legionella sp.]